jgi:hypothetical protein
MRSTARGTPAADTPAGPGPSASRVDEPGPAGDTPWPAVVVAVLLALVGMLSLAAGWRRD